MKRRFAALALLIGAACSDSGEQTGPGNNEGLAIHAGATQSGVMGQPTPVAPAVIVRDDDGEPVEGVLVTFTVASGGGSIAATTATTNAEGVASVAWTLGKTYATQSLNASISSTALVGFVATATGPDGGILAFEITDPAADTLAYTGAPMPRALDITAIRGDFKRDSLILTFTFTTPVSNAVLGGADGLFGFLEFDIDDRATTGIVPESNAFGATATLGIDLIVDLFDEEELNTAAVHSPASTEAVPVSFSGNSAIVRVPMRLLNNDDGRFSVVGVLGLVDRATDIMPNAGGLQIRP